MLLETLKRSREFQRVRGGARWATPAFVVEAKPRDPSGARYDTARFGLTITKKIGGAVVRNRIRRRIKSVLRNLEPGLVKSDHDYVIVARNGIVEVPFAELRASIMSALTRLDRPRDTSPRTGQAKRRGS